MAKKPPSRVVLPAPPDLQVRFIATNYMRYRMIKPYNNTPPKTMALLNGSFELKQPFDFQSHKTFWELKKLLQNNGGPEPEILKLSLFFIDHKSFDPCSVHNKAKINIVLKDDETFATNPYLMHYQFSCVCRKATISMDIYKPTTTGGNSFMYISHKDWRNKDPEYTDDEKARLAMYQPFLIN